MTYDQLITRLADISHRNDLGAQMANFVADANGTINRRFGVNLVAPSHTVDVPVATEQLYLFAALESLYQYTANLDSAEYYRGQFADHANRQGMLSGLDTDEFACIPPAVEVYPE